MTPTIGEEAVFSVGQTRGKRNAEELLFDFHGVRVTDCYGAYKNLKGLHQICWAHLARTARDIAESGALSDHARAICTDFYHTLSTVYQEIRAVCEASYDQQTRDRQAMILAEKIHSLTDEDVLDAPKKLTDLKERLRRYEHALFTCVTIPGIPPDNKAERKLRHLVLKRKNSFGTKTEKGSHVFEINASVLLSAWWTNRAQWFPHVDGLLRG